MKAFLCKEFGPIDSHKVEEIEEPVAGPGEVVVDIKAELEKSIEKRTNQLVAEVKI